jgi:hypothetical protein
MPSRATAHGLGPVWFATPSSEPTCRPETGKTVRGREPSAPGDRQGVDGASRLRWCPPPSLDAYADGSHSSSLEELHERVGAQSAAIRRPAGSSNRGRAVRGKG